MLTFKNIRQLHDKENHIGWPMSASHPAGHSKEIERYASLACSRYLSSPFLDHETSVVPGLKNMKLAG